jgi:cation:H+ antiporter
MLEGEPMIAFLSFSGGLALLLVAARRVVGASSDLGARLGLNPMVIGVTILAVGTSAPELAVVGQAVVADDTSLAVGSVIGSNIANVLLVLGLAAMLGGLAVGSRVVRFDVPVMLAASIALIVVARDGTLSRYDGLLFISALVAFVTWTVRATRRERTPVAWTPSQPPQSLPRIVLTFVVGIVVIAGSARLVVDGAEGIAVSLSIPPLIVGLTIVALGTSAPEIVTTLVAARAGHHDLAVGNAVGSNIFNILLVLGAAGIAAPRGIPISDDALRLDLPVMAVAALACLPVLAWDHVLRRWEGTLFVAYYLAYVVFLVLDGTGHRAADPFALVVWTFVAPLTVVTIVTVALRRRRHAAVDAQSRNPGQAGALQKSDNRHVSID